MRRIKPESIIRVILYIWSCRFFSQREYISNRYSTGQLKNNPLHVRYPIWDAIIGLLFNVFRMYRILSFFLWKSSQWNFILILLSVLVKWKFNETRKFQRILFLTVFFFVEISFVGFYLNFMILGGMEEIFYRVFVVVELLPSAEFFFIIFTKISWYFNEYLFTIDCEMKGTRS